MYTCAYIEQYPCLSWFLWLSPCWQLLRLLNIIIKETMQVSALRCISVGRAAKTLLQWMTGSNFLPNLPHKSHNCWQTRGLPSSDLLLAPPQEAGSSVPHSAVTKCLQKMCPFLRGWSVQVAGVCDGVTPNAAIRPPSLRVLPLCHVNCLSPDFRESNNMVKCSAVWRRDAGHRH